jgi:hypothetical protein
MDFDMALPNMDDCGQNRPRLLLNSVLQTGVDGHTRATAGLLISRFVDSNHVRKVAPGQATLPLRLAHRSHFLPGSTTVYHSL